MGGDGTGNLGMCPTANQSCSLLVEGMTLQPAETPGQGQAVGVSDELRGKFDAAGVTGPGNVFGN